MQGGVLAVTDLNPGSARQVLEMGGRMAERCDLELDVLYALDLRGLTLRKALPELLELDRRLASIDLAVRELIRELFPHWHRVHGPVIDVESAAAALSRRAAQLQPAVVVLPASWSDAPATGPRPVSLATIADVKSAVLIMGETRCEIDGGSLLATPTLLSPSSIEAACEWVLWLRSVGSDAEPPDDDLRLDIVLVDNAAPGLQDPAFQAFATSLVLIPREALSGARGATVRRAVSMLLEQRTAHVLILPGSPPPRLASQPDVGTTRPIVVEV